MRYAICYVSTASRDLDHEEVKSLLRESQEKNVQKDIKGILLYSEQNFFQVLEGEKKQVLEIFEKIKKDSRHHTIIQILGKDVSHGSYDSYRACIIKEEEKGNHHLPEQYLEPLKGMDNKVRQVVENILTVFIDTRG